MPASQLSSKPEEQRARRTRVRKKPGVAKLAVAPMQRGGSDQKESPRARLLRVAAHLFLTRGYARTTVRDLAQAVGILSGSLFHHFESKEAILEAVMSEVSAASIERMQERLASEQTPRSRVRTLVRCELEAIHGETGEAMTLLVSEWSSLSPRAQRRVLGLRELYERIWLRALEDARGQLVAIDAFVLRRLIQGMTAGTAHWYRPRGAISVEDLAEQIMTLVERKRRGSA